MKFTTEIENIYFELPENKGYSDAELLAAEIINNLYKFEDICPQLNLYCYESRNNN